MAMDIVMVTDMNMIMEKNIREDTNIITTIMNMNIPTKMNILMIINMNMNIVTLTTTPMIINIRKNTTINITMNTMN